MKFYNIERKLFVVHIMNIIFQMQRRWCIDATNFSQDYEWEAAELVQILYSMTFFHIQELSVLLSIKYFWLGE